MSTMTVRPDQIEEDCLIRQTLAGDKDAFTPLILKYKDSLFDMARRILGSASDAEDVVQDAFLEAYKHLSGFNHDSRFSTWVYSITLNRIRNHLRHNKVVRWTSLDAERPNPDGHRPMEIAENGPSQQKTLEQKLELEAIYKEVQCLPHLYQPIFILYYFQGMSMQDVARRLNRPPGTIKVYLHRARRLLFKRLARQNDLNKRAEPIARMILLRVM